MDKKACSACSVSKPLSEFGKNSNGKGGRLGRCKPCDRTVRLTRYANSPRVRAIAVWHALRQRIGNANGKNPSYAAIELRMTQTEFVAWYVAAFPEFRREHGDVTPSVDRREDSGHYAADNIQLIPLGHNSRKAPRNHNERAPKGQAWCARCLAYLPRTEFYKNRSQVNGLQSYCKPHAKQLRSLKDSGSPVLPL